MKLGTWMLIRTGTLGVAAWMLAAILGLTMRREGAIRKHIEKLVMQADEIADNASFVGWNKRSQKKVKYLRRDIRESKAEADKLLKEASIIRAILVVMIIVISILLAVFDGGIWGLVALNSFGIVVLVTFYACWGKFSWVAVGIIVFQLAMIFKNLLKALAAG